MTNLLVSAPHILYAVFLHLPQQDLLLIQRVCRTWRQVIASSQVLQAALYLRPPIKQATVDETAAASVQINPLLLSRFPSFFDMCPLLGGSLPHALSHNLGPFYETHWAESIRPWWKYVDNHDQEEDYYSVRLVGEPTHLDPVRSAAYRRPEASWRRMLPCMPPPVELQMAYEHQRSGPRMGTLRCLRFNNDRDPTESPKVDARDGERRWLTFGLIYDLVEAAYFRNQPSSVCTINFDWTFDDVRRQLGSANDTGFTGLPWLTGVPWLTGLPWRPPLKGTTRLIYGKREGLRDGLPGKAIGGPGRVLIMLWSSRGQAEIDAAKRFRADLELHHIDGNAFEWDEVLSYEFE